MKKYAVYIREIHVQLVYVDAESTEDAIVRIRGGEGDYVDNSLEYSSTCDPSTWEVEVYGDADE